MNFSQGISLLAFLAAVFAGGLACWLFLRRREAPFYLSLATLSGLVSLVHVANGCGLLDESQGLLWRRLALALELCLPAALSYAGLRFSNPVQQGESSVRFWRARVIGLAGLVLAGLTMTDHVLVSMPVEEGGSQILLAPWGHVPYAFVVIARRSAWLSSRRFCGQAAS